MEVVVCEIVFSYSLCSLKRGYTYQAFDVAFVGITEPSLLVVKYLFKDSIVIAVAEQFLFDFNGYWTYL